MPRRVSTIINGNPIFFEEISREDLEALLKPPQAQITQIAELPRKPHPTAPSTAPRPLGVLAAVRSRRKSERFDLSLLPDMPKIYNWLKAIGHDNPSMEHSMARLTDELIHMRVPSKIRGKNNTAYITLFHRLRRVQIKLARELRGKFISVPQKEGPFAPTVYRFIKGSSSNEMSSRIVPPDQISNSQLYT